jgi:hypothetical protein
LDFTGAGPWTAPPSGGGGGGGADEEGGGDEEGEGDSEPGDEPNGARLRPDQPGPQPGRQSAAATRAAAAAEAERRRRRAAAAADPISLREAEARPGGLPAPAAGRRPAAGRPPPVTDGLPDIRDYFSSDGGDSDADDYMEEEEEEERAAEEARGGAGARPGGNGWRPVSARQRHVLENCLEEVAAPI